MTTTSTPTNQNEHWTTVQDGLEKLAMKVDYHWQQATSKDREELEAVAKKVGTALQDAVASIRNASADPAIREDLHDVGTAFERAVTTTLGNVGDGVRKLFDSRNDDGKI
jgi:argininosuccinate lyase